MQGPPSPCYQSEAWGFPALQASMEKQWVMTLVTKRNKDPEASGPRLSECGVNLGELPCLCILPGLVSRDTQGLSNLEGSQGSRPASGHSPFLKLQEDLGQGTATSHHGHIDGSKKAMMHLDEVLEGE